MTARRMWCSCLVAIAVVIACVIAVAAAWQSHQRDEQLATNRTEVLELAGPAVAQLFSVTPGDAEQQHQRVRAVVTDEFARENGEIFASPTTPASSLTVTWKPVHTGISAVASDDVDAVVSATVTEERPGAGSVGYTKVLDVRFERSGGEWKIARADEVL